MKCTLPTFVLVSGRTTTKNPEKLKTILQADSLWLMMEKGLLPNILQLLSVPADSWSFPADNQMILTWVCRSINPDGSSWSHAGVYMLFLLSVPATSEYSSCINNRDVTRRHCLYESVFLPRPHHRLIPVWHTHTHTHTHPHTHSACATSAELRKHTQTYADDVGRFVVRQNFFFFCTHKFT